MAITKKGRELYTSDRSVITISNVNYTDFKSFKVSRSVDDVCGSFSIEISRPFDNPFKTGVVIDIVLDDIVLMRGKIYNVKLRGDHKTDNIILSGRDITGDLIDSTVPDNAKVYTSGVNIEDIASRVITALGLSGIGIFNATGSAIEPFAEDEIVSCETEKRAVEFLQDYCRKRQLFLNTDETGSLIFFRATGEDRGNRIINLQKDNNNNVISWDLNNDISERFGKYICKVQSDRDYETDVDITGEAFDTEISESRQLEFILEEAGTQQECTNRAIEESNIRRARAFEYTVTVRGFEDKTLWTVNQLVDVDDFFNDVKGTFFLKSVEYKLNLETGRTTKLVLTNKDAYTLQAAKSARESKTSVAAGIWSS